MAGIFFFWQINWPDFLYQLVQRPQHQQFSKKKIAHRFSNLCRACEGARFQFEGGWLGVEGQVIFDDSFALASTGWGKISALESPIFEVYVCMCEDVILCVCVHTFY